MVVVCRLKSTCRLHRMIYERLFWIPLPPIRPVHLWGITVRAQHTLRPVFVEEFNGVVAMRRLYVTLIEVLSTDARGCIRSAILPSIGLANICNVAS